MTGRLEKLKEATAGLRNKKLSTGKEEIHALSTRWSESAARGETLKEYPRPQMVRDSYYNLNGMWNYAITKKETLSGNPEGDAAKDIYKSENVTVPQVFDGEIRVPFSPESMLSGVERQLKPDEYLWYERRVRVPFNRKEGFHYLLHFGAVDQECIVFIDGVEAGRHLGGYLPFTIDLAAFERERQRENAQEDTEGCGDVWTFILTVRVSDVSDTSYHSRGKQKLKRGGMYYTAISGIWQTVWMEAVPKTYIEKLSFEPDFEKASCLVKIEMKPAGKQILYQTIPLGEVRYWSPDDPYLYHVDIEAGEDKVQTYFAMRKLTVEKTEDGFLRFFLNGKPCIMSGVLDQGYWSDGIYTAPSDEALIYDIQTMKDLGFNMLRKHIKIEPDRWYYHCDRLGMLVWQDMVNGGTSYKDWLVTYLATGMNAWGVGMGDGRLSRSLLSRKERESRREFLVEMKETLRHLENHPSIVAWVPFNEGWGQFDAAKIAEQLKKSDPTRFIDHASGWFDQKAGDVKSLHHYFFKLRFRPEEKRVLALSEFGGYTLRIEEHSFKGATYGYGGFETREAISDAFARLYEEEVLANVKKGISAFVYTQLSDVEDELNGILTYDREIRKIDETTVRMWNERCIHMADRL